MTHMSYEDLVFMDETGCQPGQPVEKGWSRQGCRCIGVQTGKRQPRTNVIAAWCNYRFFAASTHLGSTKAIHIIAWLKTHLIPHLRPGQCLVMDNARFHYHPDIADLLASVGCSLLYLPPYSPDFNPIEHSWSWLKSKLRQLRSSFSSPSDALHHALKLMSNSFSG